MLEGVVVVDVVVTVGVVTVGVGACCDDESRAKARVATMSATTAAEAIRNFLIPVMGRRRRTCGAT